MVRADGTTLVVSGTANSGEALDREAARELGSAGVRANVVAPGYIRAPAERSEQRRRDLLDQQPHDRVTTPQGAPDGPRDDGRSRGSFRLTASRFPP